MFLAWAVTVHKCQGLTLQEIVVDMKGRCNHEQAYVALSHVTKFEKLHINNYNRKQIKVSPSVEGEMNRLRTNILPPMPRPSVHDNQCLRIAHINIWGLKNKMEDIRNESDLLKADILCLNETRLDKYDKLDNTNPFGDERKIIRCDRNQNGGGVMIALSNKYRMVKQLLFGHPILEIVSIQICVPDPLNIIRVYRPPGYNKTKFISDLTNILNDVCDVPTCLIGDFNEDLLDIAQPNKIFTTLIKAGFIQHVKGPIIDTGTLLDHFYTLNICSIKTEVSDCYYSDHDIVFSCIDI